MNIKSDLAKKIEQAINNDDRTRDSAIEVIDNNGVLTLVGTAESAHAVEAAESIARNHRGVTSVSTDITVDRRVPDSLLDGDSILPRDEANEGETRREERDELDDGTVPIVPPIMPNMNT